MNEGRAATTVVAIDRTTAIDQLPEWLSPDEFRAFVGIGRSTVYDLLRRDEIPHVKFGRIIRIPKSAALSLRASEVK